MATVVGAEPEVVTGPGALYVAPYGTPLPVEWDDVPDGLDAAFNEVGFTTGGHEWSASVDKQEIRVAERLRPIRYQAGSMGATWTFALAQYSPESIALAIPGTTTTTTAGGSIKVTIPKSAGSDRYTLVHVSESGKVVHVLVKCFLAMTGSSTFGAVDSTDVAALEIEASVEENSEGEDAFVLFDPSIYAAA